MDFWQILRDSNTFSSFDSSQKIQSEVIEKLLWAAAQAPLVGEKDALWYEVVRQKETIENIASSLVMAERLHGASLLLIVCGREDQYTSTFMEADAKTFLAKDASAAAAYALLCATYCGIVCHHFANFSFEKLSRTIGLKRKYVPVVILALGYPKK